MRRVSISKAMRAVVLAVVVPVVAATGVSAQGSAAPDFGSGWELRVAEPMPVGTLVAGSSGVGFVARSFDGDVFWSADGLEWERTTDPTGHLAIRDLAVNERGFVAAHDMPATTSMPASIHGRVTTALFSPDGRTWEIVDVGVPAAFWVRAESGPGGFLLLAERDCEVVGRFSSDGRDWAPIEIPEGCGSFFAAPTADGWIALARLDGVSVVLSSADGLTWSDINATTLPPRIPPLAFFDSGLGEIVGLASLFSNGDALVFAGEATEGLWVSVDEGNTWAMADIDPGQVEMAVSEQGFVGVSPQRVLFSADGMSWTEYPVEMAFHDVAAAGETLVALAADGIYTWTPPDAALAATGTATAPLLVTAGAFIAVGMVALLARRQLSPHRT